MALIRKNGRKKLAKNFNEKEFYFAKAGQPNEWELPDELVTALQLIRDFAGVPIIITSSLRSTAYNSEVGGATDSLHLQGRAIDFVFARNNVANIKKVATAIRTGELMAKMSHLHVRGFGFYIGEKNFIHIDNRPTWTVFRDDATGLQSNTTAIDESSEQIKQPSLVHKMAENVGLDKRTFSIIIVVLVVLIIILVMRKRQGLPYFPNFNF